MVTAHPVDAITFSVQILHCYATELHKNYNESAVILGKLVNYEKLQIFK